MRMDRPLREKKNLRLERSTPSLSASSSSSFGILVGGERRGNLCPGVLSAISMCHSCLFVFAAEHNLSHAPRPMALFASFPFPRLTHETLDHASATRLASGASPSVDQGLPQQQQGQKQDHLMACGCHLQLPRRVQTHKIRTDKGTESKSSRPRSSKQRD